MDHIWRLSCPPPPQPKLGLASGRGRKQAMRVAGGEWNWAFFILASTYQLAMGCLPASSKDHGSCQATLSFRYSGSSLSFTSSDLRMIISHCCYEAQTLHRVWLLLLLHRLFVNGFDWVPSLLWQHLTNKTPSPDHGWCNLTHFTAFLKANTNQTKQKTIVSHLTDFTIN